MAEVCMRGVDTGFVALGYSKVAVLGVVQGITELLPISSTAHMRLVPAVLGWQDPGSAFSAAMQLAALAAVVSYFWPDVRDLAANSLRAIAQGQFQDHDLRFSLWIGLATIPIGVAGLLLANVLNTCNSPLRSVSVIGWACVGMALLLGIAEVRARHRRTIDERFVYRCDACRHRPGRRSHSWRFPIRFDPHRGARAWFQTGGGGAAFVSSRAAGDCFGWREGNLGASQNSPRCPRLVRAGCGLDRSIDFGVFRHLGPNARPRTVLDLAFRRLSIWARHRHPRWGYNGVASVTIGHELFAQLRRRFGLWKLFDLH